MLLNTKRKPVKLIETIFDLLYLSTVLISGVLLCLGAQVGSTRWQFGLMALILGLGDAFHLVPRLYAMWDRKPSGHTAMLGIGKLVASLTMTVFYVILWNLGTAHYGSLLPPYMTPVVFALAALRIALCLFPQNRWMSKAQPRKWAIWRNIPFFILGMLVMALFAAGSFAGDNKFSYLWLAVLISFACYLPVVLFSGQNPKIGMLMLPKSCAYAAIVLIGFSLPVI
ncbi:MAG: hypothetical protein ACOYI4_09745 [Christensenellales bacterium]|jgi:hypothetical protein